jgi:single-strand DNA-binding protein
MSRLNKVMLIGNLGNDPDIVNDGKIGKLSVATSESWKDKSSGERKTKTEWHRVVIFNEGLVRIAEQYLKKGSKVYLEGQLQTKSYTDKDGVEKYTTEIVLQNYNGTLTMLGENNGGQASTPSPKNNTVIDDDIPF